MRHHQPLHRPLHRESHAALEEGLCLVIQGSGVGEVAQDVVIKQWLTSRSKHSVKNATSHSEFRFYIPAVLAIAQTDLVLTVPRTLANVTKQISTLRTIEPPRELKAFPYFMSWHPRLTNEPAHVWLRDQVRIAARSIRDKSGYGQKQLA